MQGLRTQESDKFNRFWDIVQKAAMAKGMVFFGDCGEGRDFETEDVEGEDFCGWLIPLEQASEFEPVWREDNVPDKWIDRMTWLRWKNNSGIITVEFDNVD